ncbi:hypothetical protein K466DRAFT_659954 [Polyporus arcularius HHB13444]|uniref:DUF6534 domain-containing protein n=1 Tax=Polyporus arcularius HHB13444 TaxID=1314778 RepID=A0A5C3PP75_9APHY|nr:hypothetical protein K466DRAFT_659954 [Polyporus arcularius HHB13444]
MASSAMFPPPFSLPSLDSTYGAFLLGLFLGLILYGVSLHQGYVYMRTFRRDPRGYKIYVLLLLLMDTMHTVTLMIVCYEGLVSNYFRPDRLLKSTWGFCILPAVTGLVIIWCQGFFAYRICRVYQRWKVPMALVVISVLLVEMGLCIAASVKGFQSSTWFEYEKDTWIISAALCIALVLDTVLTIILITFLRYNRSGFAKTNSKLDSLIAYAICTGLLTDILNALGFAFAQASPGHMWLNFRDPLTYSESNTNYSNTLVTIELSPLPKEHNRDAAELESNGLDEPVIHIKHAEDITNTRPLAARSSI